MRSLPEIVQDWRDIAGMLLEQAEQLEELTKFFGGVAASSAPAPVRRAPAPPAPAAAAPPAPAEAAETVVEVVGEKKKRGRPKGVTLSRNLSRNLKPEEKEGIREDYAQIPPALRNRVNRAALAAKWNVSPVQIYAITRDKEELIRNLQSGRQKMLAQKQEQ